MIGTIPIDIKTDKPLLAVSSYNPSKEVKTITDRVKQDYQVGYEILHRKFTEFNDMTLLERMDTDQKAFNTYIEPPSQDPEESWRYFGSRPLTRNKIISIAAHIIAVELFPQIFAQNEADEEDKMSSNVMRDLIEYEIRKSDYDIDFLFSVIAMLVNPVVYLNVEFAEVLQKIKYKNEKGNISTRMVLDELFSGLQINIIPGDEMLISNAYQFNIQKQRFLIHKRFMEYSDAERINGEHENWKYVQQGIKALYNSDDGRFYDSYDEELSTLCEVVTYYNRGEDMEITFINGIYFGDADVNANLMKHRRLILQNGEIVTIPVYPFCKGGHEPIDEKRFFFYKSGVFKLVEDQALLDVMWRMVVDGTFLQIMPPLASHGGEKVNASIIFPGRVTPFGENSKVTPLQAGNPNAGYNAIAQLEKSMSESSQDAFRQGVSNEGTQTAYEISKLEQNAKIQLGIMGTMVGRLVRDLGELMVDEIIMHETVGQVEEITGGETQMKYRTFLLPNKTEGGKTVTKKIVFDGTIIGKKFSDKELKQKQYEILEQEGGIDSDTRIVRVNPERFARNKYTIMVSPDILKPLSDAFQRAFNLEAYQIGRQDPYINQEAWTRDFLVGTVAKGKEDKYMKKMEGMLPADMFKAEGAGANGKPQMDLSKRVVKSGVQAEGGALSELMA